MIVKVLRIDKRDNKTPIVFLVKCDKCGHEYECFARNLKKRKSFLKYKKHLCRSCALEMDYISGRRVSKFGEYATKFQKGKTFEEMYGEKRTKEIKQKMHEKLSGEKNPMYGDYEHTKGWRRTAEKIRGKHLEDVYGEEKGKEIRKRLSKVTSGKNNPMYGKPAPSGSGNGWSGWYKGFYFRSLLELSYLISKSSLEKIKSAEYIKIPYINWEGRDRNYIPDYIEDNNLIEIKPKSLLGTVDNKAKIKAAKKYCIEHGLNFIVLTEDNIQKDFNKIRELYLSNEVQFIERYKEKMELLLNEKSSNNNRFV